MRSILSFSALIFVLNMPALAQVKVYKGTSRYSSDVICRVEDGKVFNGTSSYSSDIEFSFDGKLTMEEFVAVWYAVKYCY